MSSCTRPSEMSASEEKKNCERQRFDLIEPTLEALGRSTDHIGGSFSMAECQILGHHQGEAGVLQEGVALIDERVTSPSRVE